jgi:hypothetical protein
MAGDGQWGLVVAMVSLGGLCLGWGGEVGYESVAGLRERNRHTGRLFGGLINAHRSLVR